MDKKGSGEIGAPVPAPDSQSRFARTRDVERRYVVPILWILLTGMMFGSLWLTITNPRRADCWGLLVGFPGIIVWLSYYSKIIETARWHAALVGLYHLFGILSAVGFWTTVACYGIVVGLMDLFLVTAFTLYLLIKAPTTARLLFWPKTQADSHHETKNRCMS